MSPDETLRTKNLTEQDPAPMDDTLGGHPWLPRMIDKARASHEHNLGPYYKYPCPIDAACLTRLGITSSLFAELAIHAATGRDLLTQLDLARASLDRLHDFDPLELNQKLHDAAS